jgi:CTP:molybdopterin cytidylyltransferase MocA
VTEQQGWASINSAAQWIEPPPAWQVVILAAGRGTRFEGPLPKLLAPVRRGRGRGRGMLELLLRSLLEDLQLPADQLTVVVAGTAAAAIEAMVQGLEAPIQLRRVAGSGSCGPLHSLVAALQEWPPASPPCWVLHGDTHYPSGVLECLLAQPLTHTPLLLVEPVANQQRAVEVGVQLDAAGRVIALGPGVGQPWPWRMLPAVAWPAELGPVLSAACRDPARRGWSQWQLLHALLQEQRPPTFQALKLQTSGIFDVDTLDAWIQARQQLQPLS